MDGWMDGWMNEMNEQEFAAISDRKEILGFHKSLE